MSSNLQHKSKNWIIRFGIVILFFLYIYPLKFVFIPGGISTRIIMGVVGLILLIKYNGNRLYRISKITCHLLLSLFCVSFISILSIELNGTSDYTFVFYPISAIFIMGASFFLQECAKRKISYTFPIIIDYFLYAVFLQNLVSVFLFFSPSIATTARSILIEADSTELMMESTAGFRLNGFGIAFFGAGIINSIALIFGAYRIRTFSYDVKEMLKWIIIYTIIAITGIGMARTTFVGIGLSFFVFIWESRFFNFKISKRLSNGITALGLFALIFIGIIICLPSSLKSQLEDICNFAFELFIKYQNNGEVSSSSTDQLIDMYSILPSSLKTWIIGDGLWNDPKSSHYYMSTDIGYMRLIFYFGIIGLSMFMLFQYYSIKYAIKKNKNRRLPLFLLFLICIILNFKGITDIIAYSSLFFYTNSENENPIYITIFQYRGR